MTLIGYDIRMSTRRILMTFAMDRPELEQAIREYAAEHGWILERFPLRVPHGWYGDGMLTDYLDRRSLAALADPQQLPIVSRYLCPGSNIRCVIGDTFRISRMVCDYFINRGYEHFASVEGKKQTGTQARLMCPCYALKQTLNEEDITLHDFYWYEHLPEKLCHDYGSIVDAIATFLPSLPKPTAMFVPNVNYVQMVCRACEQSGIAVPHELAILCINDDPDLVEHARPTISAVTGEIREVGFTMARILDQMMAGKTVSRTPMLINPTGIKTRQSTDVLAVDHLPTAKAINYLFTHFDQPLVVQDICVHAGLTPRALRYFFDKFLSKTPGQLLTELRIGKIEELLLTTDLNLNQIAQQTGYGSNMALSLAFKRHHHGITPGRYRQQHRVEQSPDISS